MSEGDWTVFAPVDTAFLGFGCRLPSVLADKDLLTDILLFHAIDDVVGSDDLMCTERTEMANGQDSRTVCVGDDIFQKGGSNPRNDMPKIVQTDIETCQGYIHVVGKKDHKETEGLLFCVVEMNMINGHCTSPFFFPIPLGVD